MSKNQTLYVAIDDTDNLESKGTGYHARTLGATLTEKGLGNCRYITRHQLLLSPLVPFTSHNSAACLVLENALEHRREIEALCAAYLLENSAEGSDAGLCVAPADLFSAKTTRFGFLCKHRVMHQAQAIELAHEHHIFLQGLTGTKQGLIGALAAASLCASGADGRLLWLKGMRDYADQTMRLKQIWEATDVAVIQDVDGAVLEQPDDLIHMGPWPRAIWLGGQATLIVKGIEEKQNEWEVAPKEYLKRY